MMLGGNLKHIPCMEPNYVSFMLVAEGLFPLKSEGV